MPNYTCRTNEETNTLRATNKNERDGVASIDQHDGCVKPFTYRDIQCDIKEIVTILKKMALLSFTVFSDLFTFISFGSFQTSRHRKTFWDNISKENFNIPIKNFNLLP